MIRSNFEKAARIDGILKKHFKPEYQQRLLIRTELMEQVVLADQHEMPDRFEVAEPEGDPLEAMGLRLMEQVYRASLALYLLMALGVIGLVLAG